jgi:hypothetical protein
MQIDAGHQSRTAKVYSDTISLVALATIAVALRFVARKMAGSKLWWDDWILVIALVRKIPENCFGVRLTLPQIFDYGLSICYWLQVKYGGLGLHTTAYGGPVTRDGIYMFYKVCSTYLIAVLSNSRRLDLPSPRDILLRFRHGDKNILDPFILPYFLDSSLVQMGMLGGLDHRGTLFRCRSSRRSVGMQPRSVLLGQVYRRRHMH